jgi:cysteine-rich repeat protein
MPLEEIPMVPSGRTARPLFVLAALTLGGLAALDLQACSTDVQGGLFTPDGGDASPDDDGATPKPVCGDSVTAAPEQCDDGNNVNGDGCDDDCSFSCDATDPHGLSKCDGNPCKGALSCSAAHVCTYGGALPNGASCGNGKLCENGTCTAAVCGDGIVTPPEECDDANATAGDGCEPTCKFTCVTGDATRNCTPKDTCAGQGTCSATHTCTAGTPLPNGTGCGPAGQGEVCNGGVCSAPKCGDGIVETGEDCDFGAGNGLGTGCEATCKFSCTKTPESCVTVDLCAGTNACTAVTVGGAAGQKCVTGTPPPDGTACGAGNAGVCAGGLCKLSTCGNGTVDAGEQCDFGAGANGPGTGCELDCQFSCQTTPADTCPSADPCSAAPQKCSPITVGGKAGQKCAAQTPIAACGACGGGNICVANVCKPNACGDSCVAGGETCDPPNGTTCSPSCTTIVCGDGKREGQEQCDDGQQPPKNLDGCDATCKFEQDHRANGVTILFNPSALCRTNNALGSAIASAAQSTMQSSLATGVKDGSTTIMLKFMGLSDLSGTSQASLQIGGLGGKPVAGNAYDGTNDLEWWYTTDPNSIDAARNPKTFLNGSITAKLLDATGTLDLGISLAGGPTVLHMSGAHLRSNVGGVSKPVLSSGGSTPGHLASENLDPALVSFATMSNGELCGNISAASLATVPVPAALLSGVGACNQGYTAANHLLDVLVGGCNGFLNIAEVNPTQPDQFDPAVPAAGAGAPYTLTIANKAVTGCRDKNGTAVALPACLAAAAYSSDFDFTTDRVIAK